MGFFGDGSKSICFAIIRECPSFYRTKEQNGEITGLAPLGYENFVDERGKHFVRQKEPEASIIRKCYEMYSLGKASMSEIAHYANMMGLRTRKGSKIHRAQCSLL